MILSTNVLFGVQSILKKNAGLTGMYYDYAMAAPFMAGVHEKEQIDVLILGMGTGTYATQCKRYFDNVEMKGVEIDAQITNLAREYFELPEDVPVVTYDGRAYLNAIQQKYDVIMVDAYQDITIPFQMSSLEFFTVVREHLKEDGVMVVNMNMRGEREGNINQYLADTISQVFPAVYTIDVERSTNRELFASANTQILQRMDDNIGQQGLGDLSAMMLEVQKSLAPYQAGNHILTDDQAPVELLGMRVIDDLIRDELAYYKDAYRKKGIRGLLGE